MMVPLMIMAKFTSIMDPDERDGFSPLDVQKINKLYGCP
jgi:hypothetical protein